MKHRFLTIAGLGLLIATASATAVVLARPATAADTLPEASPYTITTTGQGVVVAATDQARVVLAVEAQAATIPAAHSKATEVAAAVRAALRGQGVAEEDIHVLHYYTGPRPAGKEPLPPPGRAGMSPPPTSSRPSPATPPSWATSSAPPQPRG